MMTLDAGDHAAANRLMTLMPRQGRLPGRQPRLFQDLFTHPATAPRPRSHREREAAGLHEGLIRFSIGLDEDIAETMTRIQHCLVEAEASRTGSAHA
ncbi:MAG: hypothetical protein V5B44_23315 [Candidatus Accumulibacter necessarius]|jgi:methionine-gamma-lyase|uniref:hypothetical protein n=1 Tax=Candidatus Accumulibacter necessarius TaxID=2954386 RepID=UPI002FC2991B